MATDVVAKTWDLAVINGRRYSNPDAAGGGEGTAYFPLRITYPLAVGASPDGLDANTCCFRAYTGATRYIRGAAQGGVFPYTHSLSNAPDWLAIDPDTGIMTLTNPTAGTAADIVYRVTDFTNEVEEVTFSITVGTSGFRFLDADDGDDGGDGSIGDPWQHISRVHSHNVGTDIIYFRGATADYNLDGIATSGSGATLTVDFEADEGQPTIWLAYEDEEPVIDFGSTGSEDFVPRVRFTSAYPHAEGLRIERPAVIGFQPVVEDERGMVFVNNFCTGMTTSSEGANAAYFSVPAQPGANVVCMDNVFEDSINTPCKYYWTNYLIHARNLESNGLINGSEYKQNVQNFECRENTYDVTALAIGGNMQEVPESPYITTGEIRFNNVLNAGSGENEGAIRINQNGDVHALYVRRNTFQGNVLVQMVVTENGPIVIEENVIVNAEGAQAPWPYIIETDITDQTRVEVENNLTGEDDGSIVDAEGLLIDRDLVGIYGHELAVA